MPNVFFDFHLKNLSGSEIKILAIIIRQTYGWVLPNGKRKKRDRISYAQFETKTGLSRRVISSAIQSLIEKELIRASDYGGKVLVSADQRKGKTCIYYTPLLGASAENDKSQCILRQKDVQKSHITKLNNSKLKEQKGKNPCKKRKSDTARLAEILSIRSKFNEC